MNAATRLRVSVETDAQGQVHVVLPVGVSIPSTDLFVQSIGRSLILLSADSDPCDLMEASLSLFSDDFMQDRAQSVSNEQREEFDS